MLGSYPTSMIMDITDGLWKGVKKKKKIEKKAKEEEKKVQACRRKIEA